MRITFTLDWICLLGMLLLLSVGACNQAVEIELPPHESRMVVNAILVHNQPIALYISKSIGVLDNTSPDDRVLTDANALLFEGTTPYPARYMDTTIMDTSGNEFSIPKYYYSQLLPQAGNSYRIEVTHPDFPEASASAVLPTIPEISEVDFTLNVFQNQQANWMHELTFKVNDAPASEDWYHLYGSGLFQDTTRSNSIIRGEPFRMEVSSGLAKIPLEGGVLFSDDLFDGQSETLTFYGLFSNNVSFGNEVLVGIAVELRHVNKEYFDYYYFLPENQETQETQSGFFAKDPITLRSNVSGGFGIFAAHSFSRDTLIR